MISVFDPGEPRLTLWVSREWAGKIIGIARRHGRGLVSGDRMSVCLGCLQAAQHHSLYEVQSYTGREKVSIEALL
jgi:hypothetical protein